MIWVADYSNGADGLVARRGIGGLRELRGKRVGAEIGSISHYVLLRALDSTGMSESDLTILNQTVEESRKPFGGEKSTRWPPGIPI